jgi:hypothetical protein
MKIMPWLIALGLFLQLTVVNAAHATVFTNEVLAFSFTLTGTAGGDAGATASGIGSLTVGTPDGGSSLISLT